MKPWLAVLLALAACSDSEHGAGPAKAPAGENPLVTRFRADVEATSTGIPQAEIDRQVKKFADTLRYAASHPYPSGHAECLAATGGAARYDCTLVAGDTTKPAWFEACRASGGHSVASTIPPGTPLYYDGAFCTKTFPVD